MSFMFLCFLTFLYNQNKQDILYILCVGGALDSNSVMLDISVDKSIDKRQQGEVFY